MIHLDISTLQKDLSHCFPTPQLFFLTALPANPCPTPLFAEEDLTGLHFANPKRLGHPLAFRVSESLGRGRSNGAFQSRSVFVVLALFSCRSPDHFP
jgi:hypothetical protein